MYQLIFRNWKFALLWALGLTASVATFFERGGGNERLEASARQIRSQRQQAGPPPAAPLGTAQLDPQAEDEANGEGEAAPPGDEAEASEADAAA